MCMNESKEGQLSPAGVDSPAPLRGIRCLGWKVVEDGVANSPSELQVREAIFAVGNGLVGVRGYFEESEFHDRNHRSSSDAYSSAPSSQRAGGATSAPSEGETACSETLRPGTRSRLRGLFFAGFTEQSIVQETGWLTSGVSAKDSFLVAVPDPFCINVFIGGELVSTSTGRVVAHSRRLDLRTGVLYRLLDWESSQHQRRVRIESSRFLSNVKRNIGTMHYTVRAHNTYNTDIRITSYIALPVDCTSARACSVEHMSDSSDMNSSTSVVMTRTRNSCRRVAVATYEKCSWNTDSETVPSSAAFLSEVPPSPSPLSDGDSASDGAGGDDGGSFSVLRHRDRLTWTPMVPQTLQSEAGCEAIYSCCDNDSVCVDIIKFAGFFTEEDATVDDLCEYAETQTRLAASNGGYEALYAAQQQSMRHVWETADIKMKIDPALSAAYRFNVLQVLMASCPHSLYGFPSRGLSSPSATNGYHTWEVEAVILPFLAHVYPQRARNLLEFRCRNLHQARVNAQDMELHRGAWYPYQTVSGNDNEVPYYVAFIFLNAVIAYAMRQYVTITNDFTILFKDGGAEAVMASALVYLEWGTWDRGAFHLRSVSGPDHHSGMVDNNFFTNLMVQQHLEWAVQIASVCRKNDRCFWEELLARNEMTEDDVLAMEKAAAHLVLVFDAKNRVHAMDQFFMQKKRWSPENGPVQPPVHACHDHSTAHPLLSRYQLCCLPDVVLASMLLPEKFTSDEVKANFNFYEPITVGWDSAISVGIFSVVAAQLRLPEMSNRYLRQALFANLSNTMRHMADGVDCATAASCWWAITIGFCGMRVVQGVLHFAPTLPDECDGYQFTCRHNGCLVKVKVSRRSVKYLLLQAPITVEELIVVHAGTNRVHLRVGVVESVKLVGEIPQYNFDGVLVDINCLVSNADELLFEAWEEVLHQFIRVEKGKADFTLTQEMYRAYLQEDVPIAGLKEICAKATCSVEVSEKDQPYISTDMVLHGLCTQRNDIFHKVVQRKGLVLRDDALSLLQQLHSSEVTVGCVAGSAYDGWVLQQCPQLRASIDCFVDGSVGSRLGLQPRPALDYYVHCAKKLSCPIVRTVLILDDAQAYVQEPLDLFCVVIDLRGGSGSRSAPAADGAAADPPSDRIVPVRALGDLSLAFLDRAAMRTSPREKEAR
eukprot:gene11081-7710_t